MADIEELQKHESLETASMFFLLALNLYTADKLRGRVERKWLPY